MGIKPSSNYQSDRPESGGADKDSQRENSGLLEREKAKFAQDEAEKRADAPDQENTGTPQFSVGSPRNPEK
ncbi:MAG: hypothetical protein ABIY52_14870 [Gemmatimonadaceae bacterium]